MKKFLVAILAFLYISSSAGATVYMHYCRGKLAGVGLVHHTSKTCDKCGMQNAGQKGKDCCKDENKFLKSQTDQEATVSVFSLIQSIAIALPVSYFEIPFADIFTIAEENPKSHSSPPCRSVAVYIRNCVFLI